jgi:hypothetical protein
MEHEMKIIKAVLQEKRAAIERAGRDLKEAVKSLEAVQASLLLLLADGVHPLL